MASNETSQMLKGVLQGCLLILLDHSPSYGYAITQRLDDFGFTDVPKGTVYPLLMTMEKKGLLKSEFRESADGPKRKYYSPTTAGQTAKHNFLIEWQQLKINVTSIVNLEDDDHERS